MRPMKLKSIGTAAAILALGGCASPGPEHSVPQAPMPARWSAPADARAPDAAVLAEWWRQFGDPVLDGLVAEALSANLDLASARAKLAEARARRALAGSQLGASVDASAHASRSRSSRETGSGATRELYGASLDASWEPDLFGALARGVDAAEADVGAALETLRDVRVSLAAEVVVNYIDLRTGERRLAIAQSGLATRGETYDLARWRLEAGLVSELDVAQARTDLESARASLPALRTSVSEARNRLAVLSGRAPGEHPEGLAANARVPLPQRSAASGIPADTLRQRPDVRAASRRLAAQAARLAAARAARYPSLRLSGSLGLEALSFAALGNGAAATRSILAAVSAPIFDSGRIAASVGIQDALLEQSRLAYRSAVLAALGDVENALAAVAHSGERRARLSDAAASARETLTIAEQRYASGLADFLSVLDSQRTVLNLEDQLASGTGDLARAHVRLYKALGGGWSPEARPVRPGEPS